ncbi:hypothetical protein K501DRAFT_277365 [Backusella circina FSU 941]|nr:hypothetical protein K501DRAFT_277365 [Backusella circina FSU 941]
MSFTASDICKIILAIILPPIGVFIERGKYDYESYKLYKEMNIYNALRPFFDTTGKVGLEINLRYYEDYLYQGKKINIAHIKTVEVFLLDLSPKRYVKLGLVQLDILLRSLDYEMKTG